MKKISVDEEEKKRNLDEGVDGINVN